MTSLHARKEFMTMKPYRIKRDGSGPIHSGDRFTIDRTFTPEDVVLFSTLTGDQGAHHLAPDADGRLIVHGLLTGSLPTILGGALNFLIGTMTYNFHAPVYTSEKITCSLIIETAVAGEHGVKLSARIECLNPAGTAVLTGTCSGRAKSAIPQLD